MKKIRDDIRPLLKKEGFVLLPSNTYIREKNELLQILYFEVTKARLRPWASFMPIYLPCISDVSYGTGSSTVDVPLRRQNPYAGFDWVSVHHHANKADEYDEYEEYAVPRFNELVTSLTKAILPEMERISSLSGFIGCLQTDRVLWGNTLRIFPTDQAIINLARQSGVQRTQTLQTAAKDSEGSFPKKLLRIVMNANIESMNDSDATIWFNTYCNNVREYFRLPKFD